MNFKVIVRNAKGLEAKRLTFTTLQGLESYQDSLLLPTEAADSLLGILRRGSGDGGHVEIQEVK